MRLTSIDPEGRIAAAIPGRHLVGCVVHATCSVMEPGLVRHGFGNGLIIGEPSGTVSARVEALAARLTAAGFDTTVTERIQADIWYKLWGNMTMNPISALTGATCDRILDDPLLNRYTLAIMERLKADGAIARIRTNEAAKAQLTPDQREKLKTLRAARWQRRGGGEGGGDGTSEAPSALHDRS